MEIEKTDKLWALALASRVGRMQASEIRELLKIIEQPGVISFAGGIPDPNLFPVEHIRQAYNAILSDPKKAARALQYSVSEGDVDLRTWIVSHMASRGVTCSLENILVTHGSQQGLDFLGRIFLSPNDTALVQAPTYLGALQAFNSYEPSFDEFRLGETNRAIASYRETANAAGGDVKFAYLVPDFANPTGKTLSRVERLQALKIASELDIALIEDAPYSALRFEGEAQPSILALELEQGRSINEARTVYCGSFSKVFTPGMRVGWICAAAELVERLTLIKQASDLNSPAINQQVMAKLANKLYNDQVDKVSKCYAKKRDAMIVALEQYMPVGVAWSKPNGGMFIWLTLPEGMNSAALLDRAVKEARVAFVPGHAFFANGAGQNTLRLSFSLPGAADIDVGIKRLGDLLKSAS